jgi:hypothetical protein
MNNPKFSVIIPLYNKELEIERSLLSVMRQTETDFEVIVVNDGSSDRSLAAAMRVSDPRIRIYTQPNAGKSAARNRGIAEAKSEIVAFLDADDEWEPHFLAEIQELRRLHPNAGGYATAFWVDKGNQKIHRHRTCGVPRHSWRGILPNYFRTRGTVWSSAVAVKKDAFSKAGLFRPEVPMGEDLEMWARLAAFYPIAYSTRCSSTWHLDAGNRACKQHETGASSILEVAAKEIQSNANISPAIKEDFWRYAGEVGLDEVPAMCVRGQRGRAAALVTDFRRRYGISWSWAVASVGVHVPPAVVRAFAEARRSAVRVALSGIQVYRRLSWSELR